MYAYRRHYVKQNDYQKPEERYQVSVTRGGKSVNAVDPAAVASVEEEVMYWRKANHIHKWFVDNVQEEKDDCEKYYVSEEKLRELLAACERVIASSQLISGEIDGGTLYDKDNQNGSRLSVPGMVIEDNIVASEILPTCNGFFFGSDEYDEHYFQDVIDTRDWLNRMLGELGGLPDSVIYYQSSW